MEFREAGNIRAAGRFGEAGRRVIPGWPRVLLVCVFVVSRIVLYLCGARFDTSWLGSTSHLVDLELLRTRLGESLFYLHGQPPLFNALVGIVLKVGGASHHALLAAAIYRLLGLAMMLMLLEVMLRCGLRAWLALLLVGLFTINPGTIAMESILFHEYLTAVAVAASIFALHRFVTTSSSSASAAGSAAGSGGSRSAGSALRWCIAFFACAAVLVMVRSTFHPIWMAATVLAGIAVHRARWRMILTCGSVMLLLPLAWYGKNYVVFGQFGSHSWLGMNLSHVTTDRLGLGTRVQMIRRGELSPMAVVNSFSQLDEYERFEHPPAEVVARERRFAHVPALANRTKANGSANYHHIRYMWVSSRCLEHALTVIRRRPEVYIEWVGRGTRLYFEPVERWMLTAEPNDRHIGGYSRAYNMIVLGQFTKGSIAWFELGGTIGALAYAGVVAMRKMKRRKSSSSSMTSTSTPSPSAGWCARDVVVLYCAAMYVYYSVLTNLIEFGENNRIRYGIQPAVIVLMAIATEAALEWWKRRREGREESGRNFPASGASVV